MIKNNKITIDELTKHLEKSVVTLIDAKHLLWTTWLLAEDRGELDETDKMIMSLINIGKDLLEGLCKQVNIAINMAQAIEREQTRGDRA